MKELKHFSALLMCLFALSMPAYSADEIKYFVLWHSDGSSTAFAIEKHPCIKVDAVNKQLVCNTSTREITFTFADVRRYSFEETDPTFISAMMEDISSLGKEAESIILGNFVPFSQVNVYTPDGLLKEKHTVNNDGNLTIHTQGWAKGLYIIETEKITYKILIK